MAFSLRIMWKKGVVIIVIIVIILIISFIFYNQFFEKENYKVVFEDNSSISIIGQLSSELSEICFVDLDKVNPENIKDYPEVKKIVERKKGNVFFINDKTENIYIANMKVENYPYFICVPYSEINNLEYSYGEYQERIIQTPLNQEWCQKAQEKELCKGLDIVFGEGYKNKCCENYNLCC